MTWLMSLLAEAIHCVLMLLAAPTLAGVLRWTEAKLAQRPAPHPLQPWRDLTRLLRKQGVIAENASPLFAVFSAASLAAMAVAAALVPSFASGMAFTPWSDLLVLGGLLALPRMLTALAALDAGTGPGGLTAARIAATGCLGEPAVFLAILSLGVLGGTTNLDLLIGLQRSGMLQPAGVSALAAAALATSALAMSEPLDALAELAGPDLAIASLAEALRVLVWFDLIGAVFVPLGMAPATVGPAGWAIGLLAWVVRLVVLATALAGARPAVAQLRHAPRMLWAASALALLATALAVASSAAV